MLPNAVDLAPQPYPARINSSAYSREASSISLLKTPRHGPRPLTGLDQEDSPFRRPPHEGSAHRSGHNR
jgi:hypothetical protein